MVAAALLWGCGGTPPSGAETRESPTPRLPISTLARSRSHLDRLPTRVADVGLGANPDDLRGRRLGRFDKSTYFLTPMYDAHGWCFVQDDQRYRSAGGTCFPEHNLSILTVIGVLAPAAGKPHLFDHIIGVLVPDGYTSIEVKGTRPIRRGHRYTNFIGFRVKASATIVARGQGKPTLKQDMPFDVRDGKWRTSPSE